MLNVINSRYQLAGYAFVKEHLHPMSANYRTANEGNTIATVQRVCQVEEVSSSQTPIHLVYHYCEARNIQQ